MAKYLTRQGLEKLKKELEQLKTTGRRDMAKRLKHAASFGDFSENAAYDEAKEAKAFLEGKILDLEDIIKKAKVVEKTKQTDTTQIGSVVFVSTDSQKEKFQIVGAEEADPLKGMISYQSPIGKALMGKSVGAIVQVETPKGKIPYKILKIT